MVKSAAMFLIFALPILHAGGEDCHYGDNPPIAIIGERLTLSCTLNDENCFTTEYKWFNITGNASLPEKSGTLVVSEMVQSVDEVGGHEYMCQCANPTALDCRFFKIGALFNAIAGDYTRQAFSTYFPDKPEDTKIASILKTACSVSPKGEFNKKTDDRNSALILASALLSVVALIAITTACVLGVWVCRLRYNPSKMDQPLKSKEPSHVASNNYTTVFPSNSHNACPSENVPGEPVSGPKQHDDQRPKEDAASESHIESGSGSGTTCVEIEANRPDEGSQPAEVGEQAQEKEENQDQEPVQLGSMEESFRKQGSRF